MTARDVGAPEDRNRDMTADEARWVCKARQGEWARTAKGRSAVGAHERSHKLDGGDTMIREVGYVWSTPYSHYASGRVYTCIMGRGPTWADALIAAEKRHASNLKRIAKREATR